jgi:adenosylmethionine-8-amino-7-oxononanoate aminotransferase
MNDVVLRRTWNKNHPKIVRAEGIRLYDEAGGAHIDAVGGIYVNGIGYGVSEIGAAMARQANDLPFVYAGDFATDAETRLAEKIIALAPPGFSKVYFTCGGSEANEVAIKLARKYHLIKQQHGRWRIVARWNSYHGATMATLAVSGKRSRKTDFLPYMVDFPHVDTPNSYREPDGGVQCLARTERSIIQEDPRSIAAMIIEPITGAGSGALVPSVEYMTGLRHLCTAHDIVLIADEVVTGFGRTGTAFASSQFEMVPDIITFGKGVSSGYAPLGGVIVHERLVRTFERSDADGVFLGYTFSGHPVSCAAGSAVLDVLARGGLIERAARMGDWFFARMRQRTTSRLIGDIRGRGLLMGIELVRDRESKAAFPPDLKVQQRVVAAAARRGLIVRGETGCIDGFHGDHLLLAPAFVVSEEDVDEIITRLTAALGEVQSDIAAAGLI